MMDYSLVFLRGVSDENLYIKDINRPFFGIIKNGFRKCEDLDGTNTFVKFCQSEECNHSKNGTEEVSITW